MHLLAKAGKQQKRQHNETGCSLGTKGVFSVIVLIIADGADADVTGSAAVAAVGKAAVGV